MAQRNEPEFLIHKCLTHTNEELNLEDTLPTLLDCYGKAPCILYRSLSRL